ncbi:MAG TPA: hypothetical protein VGA35_10755, partial [bacterium]
MWRIRPVLPAAVWLRPRDDDRDIRSIWLGGLVILPASRGGQRRGPPRRPGPAPRVDAGIFGLPPGKTGIFPLPPGKTGIFGLPPGKTGIFPLPPGKTG